VVDKILLYENPAAGDDGDWRKRVLMFSDDEWVRRRVSGRTVHKRGCAEWDFFRSIRKACGTVDGAFPGDLHCVPFYLHEFSDMLADQIAEHTAWPIDSLPNPPCTSPAYVAEHSGSSFTEVVFYDDVGQALTDSIGEGVLFFALQSHANRAVVSDEQVILRRDPFKPDFVNHGKPFVFFGFGCHLNEFGVAGEDTGGRSGDALGELYVTVPERAAVASYASTGFEFLRANNRFHEGMWRAIFEKRFFRDLGGGGVDPDTLRARWLLSALVQISEISHGDRNIIDRYALLGDPLLQLDAGVPRFVVEPDSLSAFFLAQTSRIGGLDPGRPAGFRITVNDEQGIDSLWVERRFVDGRTQAIEGVTITSSVDSMPQVRAKRSYTLQFEMPFDACDFDVVVGARDVASRVSEFVGRAHLERTFLANGVPVHDGDQVDGTTSFRYEFGTCTPLPTSNFAVLIDGQPVAPSVESDELRVTWLVDFVWEFAPGSHTVQMLLDGEEIDRLELGVRGVLGLRDVVVFPNPFEDLTRVFFNLDSADIRGHLRIMDLNGRTVRTFDLSAPGVVGNLLPGSSGGPTTLEMNYVEWDGTDRGGDRVANGIYLYELRIEDANGRALSKWDKIVLMQ
ncbi:MAG: C25 family cysteine peptidase, partial [Candidatus Krumholzibacteriia bacterium]